MTDNTTVLVIDDEKNIRRTLRMVLESESYEVLEAPSAEQGLKTLDQNEVDLVLLDIRLPKMSGIDALQEIRKKHTSENLPVVVISGHASVAEAVQAIQIGATDFFEKPLDRERVLITVRNAIQTLSLRNEVKRLRSGKKDEQKIVGKSDAVLNLLSQIEKIAPTQGRVLITGESGTGKELIARAIHDSSARKDKAFVKVNCAAIPSELIESELFGHEKGSFTGAQEKKKGVFELADGGTLFLDEIGDMSLNAQAKVLRALQNGEIQRVGGQKIISVDVRVIAATNKDLIQSIEKQEFREDLYFRLNVIPIQSPPLRERKDDIEMLVAFFLETFSQENNVKKKPISMEAIEALKKYDWPGNIRELRNVVERMTILSGDEIQIDDVPKDVIARTSLMPPSPFMQNGLGLSGISSSDLAGFVPEEGMPLKDFKEKVEKNYIIQTLRKNEWNISRSAQTLGVERTNLHKKIRAFGLERETD